jgi:hypothetical protein
MKPATAWVIELVKALSLNHGMPGLSQNLRARSFGCFANLPLHSETWFLAGSAGILPATVASSF